MSGQGTLRGLGDLVAAGLLPAEAQGALEPVAARYAIAVTPAMARASAASAAVHRQFVPDAAELRRAPEERDDPIGDKAHEPVPGIVHRHPDRVLFKVVSTCPVYCRFCFRREMIGPGTKGLSAADIERALGYIADHKEIWEVIFTGGDPFILSPRRMTDIIAGLEVAPHVKLLRWHTRVPVVDPGAVTRDVLEALTSGTKTAQVVLHTNHIAELTEEARRAVAALVDRGVPVLSQTVLLRGVNDDADTLAELMRGLVEMRVTPYYLHHPDLAPGTGHFRLSLDEGAAIVRRLRETVSGLCQPTYVVDIPGGVGKVPVDLGYVDAGGGEARYLGRTYRLD